MLMAKTADRLLKAMIMAGVLKANAGLSQPTFNAAWQKCSGQLQQKTKGPVTRY
jgi:hypothetical protein